LDIPDLRPYGLHFSLIHGGAPPFGLRPTIRFQLIELLPYALDLLLGRLRAWVQLIDAH
jgi:hypothetical protein